MPEEEDLCFVLLQDKLDASLERNCCLEKENEQLKQEVIHLKNQLALLRAQDSDRRSVLWKKVHSSISNNSSSQEKQMIHAKVGGEDLADDSSFPGPEFSSRSPAASNERLPRVPKPPPRPTTCLPSMPKETGKEAQPPPPPPPPPLLLKRQSVMTNAVRRVPEVVEFYRALTRRDGKAETRTGAVGIPVVANAREMIGEIENRSAYLYL